jgi:hypothetical protein
MSKKDKTAIQLSVKTRDLLKSYCNKYGYKMSGFVEKLILEKINNENKDLYSMQKRKECR